MSRQSQGSMLIVGAIAGGIFLVALVALMIVGGYTFSPALFLASGVALVAAVVLFAGFHRKPRTEPTRLSARVPRADTASAKSSSETTTSSTPSAAAPAAGAAGAAHDDASAETEKVERPEPEPQSPEPEHHEPEPQPAAFVSSGDTGDTDAEAPEAEHASASGDAIGTEPERLDSPREGGADDLKRIKGVGPKLEEQLNRMGIYHIDQIASWSDGEVVWMDENLVDFRGRVSRDDWVGQARQIAAGGETEFSRRVDEGEVYND